MANLDQSATDDQLVALAKENPDNFAALVERYQQRLLAFVRRISYFSIEETEDIVQEAFIKVYRYLNSYDDSLKFSTWIYQITRNTVIDAIRQKHARPQNIRLEEDELVNIFRASTDIAQETIDRDHYDQVENIISQLPYKYKEVMVLRFLEEKSYEEIMDIIKKPKGTVASLINRGRKLLAKEATKQGLL
ncbi:MAG: sigma-70 family RNA polymerase sigma factor [Parcubacteria group bacterium]|nr:sigma-70 family RNA polymerase sigma factor [Parcubacteria group bacterium]